MARAPVRRRGPLLVAAGLLLLAATGAPADRPAGPPAGPLTQLLALVPASPGAPAEVLVEDIDGARRRAGLLAPDRDDPTAVAADRARLVDREGLSPSPLTDAEGLPGAVADVAAGPADDRFEATVMASGRVVARPGDLPDPARSLATDADLVALASALDDAGAHAGRLTTDVAAAALPAGLASYTGADPLLPYRAAATGIGRRADGPCLVVVLLHADNGAARANASRVAAIAEHGVDVRDRRRWSDLAGPAEVRETGRVVVAVFPRLRTPALWLDLGRHPDSLLWWRA